MTLSAETNQDLAEVCEIELVWARRPPQMSLESMTASNNVSGGRMNQRKTGPSVNSTCLAYKVGHEQGNIQLHLYCLRTLCVQICDDFLCRVIQDHLGHGLTMLVLQDRTALLVPPVLWACEDLGDRADRLARQDQPDHLAKIYRSPLSK